MDNRFPLPLIAALVRKRCWDAAVTAKTGKLLWFLPNTFKATMRSTLTPSKVFFFFFFFNGSTTATACPGCLAQPVIAGGRGLPG